MASASRTRPPTSGSRDGDGEAPEQGFESLAPMEAVGAAASNPGEWPFPVLQLVHEARAAPSEPRRREVAGRLNQLLDEMAREGGSRRVADVFHGLLDGGALKGLVDERGRTCHAAAVEGLLSLGFPYALEVRPEDLDGLHEARKQGAKRDWREVFPLLLVVLAGVLGQLVWEAWEPIERSPPTPMALAAFALVAVALGAPRSALHRLGVGVLAGVSGLSVVLSLVVPGYAGLWVGLAGLVAAFLAARQES